MSTGPIAKRIGVHSISTYRLDPVIHNIAQHNWNWSIPLSSTYRRSVFHIRHFSVAEWCDGAMANRFSYVFFVHHFFFFVRCCFFLSLKSEYYDRANEQHETYRSKRTKRKRKKKRQEWASGFDARTKLCRKKKKTKKHLKQAHEKHQITHIQRMPYAPSTK